VLLFHATFQTPPGRLAALGAAPLGDFHILDDAFDVELVFDDLVDFVIGIELFSLCASTHGGIRLRAVQPSGRKIKPTGRRCNGAASQNRQ
jgi:hypothetical protein